MREYLSNISPDFFSGLSQDYENYNYIPPEHFQNYNVKRGLRNPDGTGVVAGVTRICNVHGYLLNEGEKMPVNGELTYRGFSVNDLVEACVQERRFGFEEIAYLLILGHLPNEREFSEFNEVIGHMRSLPSYFAEDMILRVPSQNIMSNLARAVMALYAYDENAELNTVENNLRQSLELLARFPIITAYAYQAKKHSHDMESLYIHFPQASMSTAENILHIIRKDSSYTAEEAHLLDIALMLHAEHGGGNNSTFTTRVLTSAGTDIYSAIASAVGSLKGPKHGGANIKAAEMIAEIKENVRDWADEDEIEAYLIKILEKKAGDGSGLIYGMGHAIYTLSDPRAVLLRKHAEPMALTLHRMDELLVMDRIAKKAAALLPQFKNNGKIVCQNVDFYSGFIYSMLNIPLEVYTALFAIARISGWCAHRIEELCTSERIIRPAYKSIAVKQPYTPMTDR